MQGRKKSIPDGCVAREAVFDVLTHTDRSTADISITIDKKTGKATLVKDANPEVYIFPEYLPRKMLARLAGKYAIRIEYFYHPQMMEK